MLPATVLTLAAVLAGTLASYLYADELPITARLGLGAVSGLTIFALVGFVVANLVGIDVATAILALLVLPVLALGLRRVTRARVAAELSELWGLLRAATLTPGLRSTGVLLYAFGLILLLVLVFSRVIVLEAGAISTGYVNNLGDLPLHMQITSGFSHGQNFPPQDPTYAGTGFVYPYMVDFLTALLVVAGATLQQAFFLSNLCLGLALVAVIHHFTRELSGDSLAALIAPPLVLLSGGMGWWVMLSEVTASEKGVLAFVQALPHDYTIGLEGYRWGNAITTLLVPQRGLLFGLPLALVVFTLLWRLIQPLSPARSENVPWSPGPQALSRRIAAAVRNRPEALAAGIFTGTLPLVHAHTFGVVMGTAFLLGLVFRQWREGRWLPWAIYFLAALTIALPEIWWSTRDSIGDARTFIGFELGWDRGSQNPAVFWLRNTGLFIPLILLALLVPPLRRRTPRDLILFSLPFAFWFVLPNVVKLAPWVWDNIKVLFYWYVGFVPIVALLISRLLRERLILRLVGMASLLTLVLAGSLDVSRVISGQTLYRELDADGVDIAGAIVRETPPRARILHAPTWNAPVFLTGRQSLLGYPGHVWTRGLDHVPRETDIRLIYAGGPDAGRLLARHGIEYVLISPLERSYTAVNEAFFSQYREIAVKGDYRLYQIVAP